MNSKVIGLVTGLVLSVTLVSCGNTPSSTQAAPSSPTSDAAPSDAMKGDAMKGDAMKGDAMKGDAMKGDAMKGDAMKSPSPATSP